MTTLYQILQSKQSSGSGTGASYYDVGGHCGRKSRLKILHPQIDMGVDDGTALTPGGKRKVNALRAGTFFHALQEMWRTGQQSADEAMDITEAADYDFEIACRSFRHYRERFGSPNNLGTVLGAEVRYPGSDAQLLALAAVFGDSLPVSFRYDLLVDISEADCDRIASERRCALNGPGKYLVDYKLVGSITNLTFWKYTTGPQALLYPLMYNACHPEDPVKGMLYDVTARVAKPEDKHFQLFLAEANPHALEMVKGALSLSKYNHDNDVVNIFHCSDGYNPCPFLTSGICDRIKK